MSANGSGGCPEVGSIGLERLWDCARVLPRSRLLALSGSRLPQSGSPATRAEFKGAKTPATCLKLAPF